MKVTFEETLTTEAKEQMESIGWEFCGEGSEEWRPTTATAGMRLYNVWEIAQDGGKKMTVCC